jgi:hypothetical protein
MAARHRREIPRAVTNRRIAGAGVAGVAAVFATAPFAHADPVGAATASTSLAESGQAAHQAGAARPADSKNAVTPNYGFQKIRVGVQIKSGAYVPDGTSTAGTEVTITETGPFADQVFGGPEVTTCTTDPSTATSGSTATYCTTPQSLAVRAKMRAQAKRLALPAVDPIPNNQFYTAGPGDTVTFEQTSVNANLFTDPDSRSVDPCTLPDGTGPVCADEPTVLFTDNGLPPQTKDDSATVVDGHSVDIDVLSNDDAHGAPETISDVSDPKHGSAKVVSGSAAAVRSLAAAGSSLIRYTPAPGFVGHDSFSYTLSTANGTATGTVSVAVTAPPPTATDDRAHTAHDTAVTIDVLANDDANGGGALGIQSVGHPAHGTAQVKDGKVVYTPNPSFSGTDTFSYTAVTSGGTDTAQVTVTVAAAAPQSTPTPPLANTGGPALDLTELGVLLLVTGGAATAAGRRRHRAKHAGPA